MKTLEERERNSEHILYGACTRVFVYNLEYLVNIVFYHFKCLFAYIFVLFVQSIFNLLPKHRNINDILILK